MFKLEWKSRFFCLYPIVPIVADDIRSIVFNSLRATSQVSISYFFFNHSDPNQKSEAVIRVLLRQILQFGKISEDVVKEHWRYDNELNKSPSDYSAMLHSCIVEFFNHYHNPVFLLLDTYNEFRNEKDEQKEKEKLLNTLHKVSLTGSTKLFITTRWHYREELRVNLNAVVTDIEADIINIEKYLDDRLNDPKWNEDLRRAIKTRISHSCQKWYMFLNHWA